LQRPTDLWIGRNILKVERHTVCILCAIIVIGVHVVRIVCACPACA
jgi:hypothetical protein